MFYYSVMWLLTRLNIIVKHCYGEYGRIKYSIQNLFGNVFWLVKLLFHHMTTHKFSLYLYPISYQATEQDVPSGEIGMISLNHAADFL